MAEETTPPDSPEPLPEPPRPDTDTARAAGPVPQVVKDASEWSIRLLAIGALIFAVTVVLREFSQVVVPVVVALLLTAALWPLRQRLAHRFSPGAAAGLTVLLLLALITGLVALVAGTVTGGMPELTAQAATGIQQIRDWLHDTFHLNDTQISAFIDNLVANVRESGQLSSSATKAGLTATHFVAGLFIALFTTFFFLYEGAGMWRWVVRLFPRTARDRAHSSGQVAFAQLSAFVRATVIVAAVDAVGITAGALVLRVPFAWAIGVLVFLLSFIPIVGALLSGAVAVLLALVAHGPVVALIMLGVVLAVQQLESHILQPFILGRTVHLHPVAVILAIAAGSIAAGIVGALAAVPTVAVLNAVVKHLAGTDIIDPRTEEELLAGEPLSP